MKSLRILLLGEGGQGLRAPTEPYSVLKRAFQIVVLSETAEFLYKATDYYVPEFERSIIWNDAAINIQWPIDIAPMLSAKDQQAKTLVQAEHFA